MRDLSAGSTGRITDATKLTPSTDAKGSRAAQQLEAALGPPLPLSSPLTALSRVGRVDCSEPEGGQTRVCTFPTTSSVIASGVRTEERAARTRQYNLATMNGTGVCECTGIAGAGIGVPVSRVRPGGRLSLVGQRQSHHFAWGPAGRGVPGSPSGDLLAHPHVDAPRPSTWYGAHNDFHSGGDVVETTSPGSPSSASGGQPEVNVAPPFRQAQTSGSLSASTSPSSCAEPRCSISRKPRSVVNTISTAVAPVEVDTVRT